MPSTLCHVVLDYYDEDHDTKEMGDGGKEERECVFACLGEKAIEAQRTKIRETRLFTSLISVLLFTLSLVDN